MYSMSDYFSVTGFHKMEESEINSWKARAGPTMSLYRKVIKEGKEVSTQGLLIDLKYKGFKILEIETSRKYV